MLQLAQTLETFKNIASVPVQHGSSLCRVVLYSFLRGCYPMPMGTPHCVFWVQVRRAKPWLIDLSRCWYGGRGSYFSRVSCWSLRSISPPFGVFGTILRHFLDVLTNLTFRVDLIFESFLLLFKVILKYEVDHRPSLLEVNTTVEYV